MANLSIAEFGANAGNTRGGLDQAVQLPPVAEQVVAIGAASALSAAISAGVTKVRLQAGADCHVAVGANPTATVNNMPLSAGHAEYFGVAPGDKVAVIQAS